MDEFELIRRYFSRAGRGEHALLGVGDDGAIVELAAGKDLVAVVDTLVEGVHYPPKLAAEDVGYRAVAVNLSDIAAMGARPRWMLLSLTLRRADPDWLEAFADGLYAAADPYAVELIGGDTTRGSQTVATVQILGEVETARAMRRDAAAVGDAIFVSGTLGDAAVGLSLVGSRPATDPDRYLMARFRRPAARVDLGCRIAPLARGAIDVSDGLYADLGKLLEASGRGAGVELDRLPLSDALLTRFDAADARRVALSGGDDYELCFTAAQELESELIDIGGELGLRVTRIGTITDTPGIVCTEDGEIVDFDDAGYVHFLEDDA